MVLVFCCFVRGRGDFGRLPTLPLALFLPPIPPPPFPGGEGGEYFFISPGATAPGTPGLSGARHWLDLPVRHSAGGLLSCLPANPAFGFLFCPYPPAPLPRRGRGRLIVFLCKGLRPLHPRGWTGRGTYSPCRLCPRRGLARAALGHGGRSCVRRGASPRQTESTWGQRFRMAKSADFSQNKNS